MATVAITGTLSDFGLILLNTWQPRVVFRPRNLGLKGQKVLSTRPVIAVPNSNGVFLANLEPTNETRPHVVFDVSVEWLEPGSGGGSGYASVDILEGFEVPPQNGTMGDIAALDYLPTDVFVSRNPPPNPAVSLWWYNPETGDLLEWM